MNVAIDQNVIDTLRLSAIDAATAALKEREKPDFERSCHRKQDGSWVTPGDEEAQKTVVEAIRASHLPQELRHAAILGEEDKHGNTRAPMQATEYRWVIDPVDGTSNFIRGRPVTSRAELPAIDPQKPEAPQKRFAVSIALQHRDDQGRYGTVAGAVFCLDPDASSAKVTGDLYWSDASSAHLTRIEQGKIRQTFQLLHGQVAQNMDSEHRRLLVGPVQLHAALGSFPEDGQGGLRATVSEVLRQNNLFTEDVPSACVAMMDMIGGHTAAYVHGKHFAWDTAAARDILGKAGIPVAEYDVPGQDALPEYQHKSTLIAARAPEVWRAINDAYNDYYQGAAHVPQLLYTHNLPSQRAAAIPQAAIAR